MAKKKKFGSYFFTKGQWFRNKSSATKYGKLAKKNGGLYRIVKEKSNNPAQKRSGNFVYQVYIKNR
jgi:hypothetical protein